MCAALIGGMYRLKNHYIAEAERFGIELKVFNEPEADIASRIRNVDALVIFTNKVSHRAKQEVMNVAKSRNIRVLMCHPCGVCTLRNCFDLLKG